MTLARLMTPETSWRSLSLDDLDEGGDGVEAVGGEDDAIVSRPRPVLCRLQKPEELDDRVPLGHAAEELTRGGVADILTS